jgi:hypothetical protein
MLRRFEVIGNSGLSVVCMSWGFEVKGRRMRKTAIMLTACKCMSERLMVLALLLGGGGYAGLLWGRTHSASSAVCR